MENWKIIPGYNGRYSISDKGRVRNNETGHLLKHTLRKGYHNVSLYLKRKGKIIRVHNYMIRIFTNNWDNNLVAAHLDGNKNNNEISNIKLITQKENIQHKEIHGTKLLGSKHPIAKLDSNKVREIKKLLKQKTPSHNTYSNRKIARMFNVCETTISNISCGKIWSHVMEE